MPRQKDLKRVTRARMKKTGESYTTARAHLLEKKTAAVRKPAEDYAAAAGTGDAAVEAKTGKPWKHWVDVLDKVNAHTWQHAAIAKYLYDECGVPGWWAQTITVGYERIRGLRAIGQRRDGTREISRSRTVPVSIGDLYKAWSNTRTRKRWLPDTITVRKANPEKTVRLRWADDTPVEIYFASRGEARSQIAVQHRGLASKEDAERMKAIWSERLDTLVSLLA